MNSSHGEWLMQWVGNIASWEYNVSKNRGLEEIQVVGIDKSKKQNCSNVDSGIYDIQYVLEGVFQVNGERKLLGQLAKGLSCWVPISHHSQK